MMKNDFYFMLKAIFVLESFVKSFGYEENQLDKKVVINFKIYDVSDCTANNYNTHTAQYLKKKGCKA